MIKNLSYELSLLFKQWRLLIFLLVVLIALSVYFFMLPSFSSVTLPSLGYPLNVFKEDVLNTYRNELDEILNAIQRGEYPYEFKASEIEMYKFYLNSSTTEYDYLFFDQMVKAHMNDENLAGGMSLLNGFRFVDVALPVIMSAYFFGIPLEKNKMRSMLLSGNARQDIFKSKNVLGVSIILGLNILIILITSLILSPYFGQKVFLIINEGFKVVPLYNIFLSMILSMMVMSLFMFLFSQALSLWIKRGLFPAAITIVFFMTCFLFSNVVTPKWGYYGDFAGVSRLIKTSVPLANLFIVPMYGFHYETSIILVFYTIAGGVLYLFNRKRFKVVSL